MGNRKKLMFHYLTRHSFGVSMFCADLANEVFFIETAIKFGSSIRLLFQTVFESQTIRVEGPDPGSNMFAKTKFVVAI